MFQASNLSFAMLCGLALGGAVAPAQAGTYKQRYAFQGGSDGALPKSSLIDVGGTLYGTTFSGGKDFDGTVYAVNAATGAETVLYLFQGPLADGNSPWAGLTNVGGVLYGTTTAGGTAQSGTVFALNLATGKETVVHSFHEKKGAQPTGGLTMVGRKLFGTGLGGANNDGTAYSVSPASGVVNLVHVFDGIDGQQPAGNLTALGGKLYGIASYGGANNRGTVYSLNPNTGAVSAVYSFTGDNLGWTPGNGLTVLGGLLYGTTPNGGSSSACTLSYGCGTVFSVDPATGVETVLYSFQGGTDGSTPDAGLVKVGDKFYGTTSAGGTGTACGVGKCGTIFELNPATGAEKVVYSFKGGTDGQQPQAALINAGGTLYGTTNWGGAAGTGTVFSFTP